VEFARDVYDEIRESSGAHAFLHVYEVDKMTSWFNKAFLEKNECGAYHVGVEVFGDEWSFAYYTD